jgi:hypothetical protein
MESLGVIDKRFIRLVQRARVRAAIQESRAKFLDLVRKNSVLQRQFYSWESWHKDYHDKYGFSWRSVPSCGGGRTGLRQASNQSFVAFLCASGREFIICCMCFASGVELVILFTLLMHPAPSSTKFAPVSQWWRILNGLHTYSCSEYI